MSTTPGSAVTLLSCGASLFHAASTLTGLYFVAWLGLEYARLRGAAVPLGAMAEGRR